MPVDIWQLFPEVEVNSEQLFTEVEVNILGFSPTLRWIITLAYTKPVYHWSKNYNDLCIFIPYFEICKQIRKLTIVSC